MSGSFARRRKIYLAVREVFESHSIVALNSADVFFRTYWCYHAISFTSLLSSAILKYAKIKEKQSTLCLPA